MKRTRPKVLFMGKWVSPSWYSRLKQKSSKVHAQYTVNNSSVSESDSTSTDGSLDVGVSLSAHSYTQISNIASEDSYDEEPVVSQNRCTDVDFQPTSVLSSSGLAADILCWAVWEHVKMSAVTSLLKILRCYPCTDTRELPSDARTLLRTPRSVKIEKMGNGMFFYFGLKRYFKQNSDYIIKNLTTDTVQIAVHIDGINLFKSSNKTLWPILCKVIGVPDTRIFVAGLYLGPSKPENCDQFLMTFYNECVDLINNKVDVGEFSLNFRINHIVADAPAKSFILNTKGHTGYGSCLRCQVYGTYSKGRVSFFLPEGEIANLRPRNAEDFRLCRYNTLQKGSSVLSSLPFFDPIQDIPYDYMHLICLGVTRTLIKLWMSRKRCHSRELYSLSYIDTLRINKELKRIAAYCPVEFPRKCRELTELAYWKATEFRLILVYVGIIAFRNRLKESVFKHFLLLHFSVRLLCDPVANKNHLPKIEKLIQKFVAAHSRIYGKESVVHNVHGLLHICDDVRRFGALDNYSAFPFENYLFQLKKSVRCGPRALQQIVNRISEASLLQSTVLEKQPILTLQKEHCAGPLPSDSPIQSYQQFSFLKTETFTINCKKQADNVVILLNNSIIRVINILKELNSGKVYVLGYKFKSVTSFYDYPASSKLVGIYKTSDLSEEIFTFEIEEIRYKGFSVPIPDSSYTVVASILHTVKNS